VSGSRPEWKVLEPEDREDAVEHEICGLVPRNSQWNLMYASVRGKLHAHRGLWRDDALTYGWTDDWTVIALSDGAGASRLSRVGARIACDEGIKALKELLNGFRLAPGDRDTPDESDLYRLRAFLEVAALRAKAAIMSEARLRQCLPSDMDTTLLLTLHTPFKDVGLVGAIQVGDGAIGILTDGETCTLMGVADHGEYSSETRFLTTPHIEYEFPQRILFSIKKGIRCIAIMCDGVSDDFFPEDKRLVELFVGRPIRDLKTKEGGPVMGVMDDVVKRPRAGNALLEWLRYELKGSSDDRTLILFYRCHPV
jgi:serine/threonine protein phosphatase PrpC